MPELWEDSVVPYFPLYMFSFIRLQGKLRDHKYVKMLWQRVLMKNVREK